MPAPIIPWNPSNIPIEIQNELNRRKVNRSFSYVKNDFASWDNSTGDWNTYRGPMTSWIRMCSNGAGHPLVNKPRFVLYSGKGFYKSYGFQLPIESSLSSTDQIIGYTPGDPENGISAVPHVIENSLITSITERSNYPIHVPPPEISRIDVTIQKELFRRATVEWVCFSWKQLQYMTPYFLVPGITVMLEWGWNHFNPQSLVPLYDTTMMKNLYANSYPLYINNILKSNGNYDVIYGIISNFNWSIEGNKILCSTEITSKDRLYAGISKNITVLDKSADKEDEEKLEGIFQSIKDFLSKDETILAIKNIANSPDPLKQLTILVKNNPRYSTWRDIISPLLTKGGPEVIAMRIPYVHGVFSGRPKNFYSTFGPPDINDFDKSTQDNDPINLWINMGLIVEILNYFSGLPGNKNKKIFEVDIQNTVIGGHPNLISCDPRVLIPNYQAPKYHYGLVGLLAYEQDKNKSKYSSEYKSQYLNPILVKSNSSSSLDLANKRLKDVCMQEMGKCYRNDLSSVINMVRDFYVSIREPFGSWSFPSMESGMTPPSINGLHGNYVEKDYSGLLSNVYVSYAAFKSIIDDTDPKTATYSGIYESLLKLLSDSVDGFWDLSVVDAENTLTITDRRYIGNNKNIITNMQGVGDNPLYTFDYMDADSLIKTIKFRPTLSDAQATRVIYAESNNPNSKYSYFDKNDLMNYQFKDYVNYNEKDSQQGDVNDDMQKRKTSIQQMRDLIRSVQYINMGSGDDSFQMTFKNTGDAPSSLGIPPGKKEIMKLVLPSPQILRMLLDDKDKVNNNRYCAVQPNIVLEMVLLGIGGLRTFQYFLVKNLPEPYSHRNIIFRIVDVVQSLESGNWETTIHAQPIPLRKYIINRISGPGPHGEWPQDILNQNQ